MCTVWHVDKYKITFKLSIPGESLAARYNWCQGPVPSRILAVEKHWVTALDQKYQHNGSVLCSTLFKFCDRTNAFCFLVQAWRDTFLILTTLRAKLAYVSEYWGLEYDDVSLGERFPTFRRYCRSQCPTDTPSYPIGPESSTTPL